MPDEFGQSPCHMRPLLAMDSWSTSPLKNTSIAIASSPRDANAKADRKQVLGMRDVGTNGSQDPASLTIPKLADANATTMAACQRPSTFAGLVHHHHRHHHHVRPAQEREEASPTKPSLQYLITRARKGSSNKPRSANASPLRLSLRQHHEDLAKAVEELQYYQAEQPDDEVRQALADVATHCLRQSQEGSFHKTRLKRNPSSEAKRSPMPTPERPAREERSKSGRNKSRRLSPCTSFVTEANTITAQVSPAQSQGSLRLPDPSSISNRRILFAMSRKMCSRSNIQSFGSDSEDEGIAAPVVPATTNVLQGQDGNASRPEEEETPQQHIEVEIREGMPRLVSIGHELAVVSQSQDSAEEKDDDSISVADSIMSVEEHNEVDDDDSSSQLPRQPAASDQDEDESIAFSLDSVRMRKKQFDGSHHTRLNQSGRTFRSDWAVNGQNQVPVRSTGVDEPAAPPRQIVCECDFEVVDEGDLLHTRFQFQTRLCDDDDNDDSDDDDSSLASLSSLDTAPLAERMEELDPWGVGNSPDIPTKETS